MGSFSSELIMKLTGYFVGIGLSLLMVIHGCFDVKAQQTSTSTQQLVSLPEGKITIQQIDSIFSLFNTFDYIRSGNTKEDVIDWLILYSEKLDYPSGIARGKNLKGVLLRDRSRYNEAIKMHQDALGLAGNDTTIMVYSLNNLGVAYRRLDKPRIALDYHLKALNLSEQFKGNLLVAKRSTCFALNSIGNINLTLEQPDKALEMFKRSLELEKNLFNDLGIAINLQNIGYAYEAMGKIDTAITYFRQSLQYNEQVNSTVGRAICLNSIGEYYLKKNQPVEALKNFNMAMVFASKSNDVYYISQTHANMGKAYMALNRFDLALPELEKYNLMALDINSGLLVKESHNLLADYYEKKGNTQLALEHLKSAIAINDSIVNEKNSRYLNELQSIYEADKQQQQIELLTAENEIKTQRTIMLLVFAIAILILVVMAYVGMRKRTLQQKTELELKLFRSQMNPHFIFNALGSIQSFMYHNEPGKAASYLGQFSSLTRSVLKNSSRELVTLEEELETLKNYLEIEKMRKRDYFDYEIVVDETVEADFIYIPPIILQPLVENAILHGFMKMDSRHGYISIKVKNLENHILISITDNGMGINASLKNKTHKNHQSMGLKIFRDRIRLIEKKYKKTIKFEVLDLSEKNPGQSGTMVSIYFPIIEPDDKSRNN